MVNYSNPDLFYEHDETHLVIVNAGATVTGVSGDEPTITGADFVITEDDITDDEIELRECLCSADNLKFGSMEASCFLVKVFDSADIPYLKDEEIKVYIYFDEDSSTLFTVGKYIVQEDSYSDDRTIRNITAYDMIYYLRDYDIAEWYYNTAFQDATTRTIKWLRDSLFTWLNTDIVDYTIEQEETTLVNDDWLVEKSIESDVITFGFFMQRLAEFNGVFLHIDRNGIFRYIQLQWYDQPAVKVFDEEQLFPPIQYGGDGKEITVWGIAYILVYDKNNIRIAKVGSSNKKHPSNYTIVDSFIITNELKRDGWKDSLKTALSNLRNVITHLRYKPFEGDFEGNLCYEVGDRIDIELEDYDEETDYTDDDEPIIKGFYTYILERTCKGLQEFEDNYIARGDKKQPKYVVKNDKWHSGDGNEETIYGADGISLYDDKVARWFVQVIRNIGFRLLDEPSNVSVVYNKQNHQVEIKWEDPVDITTFNPQPAEWEGTVVVRKTDNAPLHRYGGKWGGTLLTDSQVRDQYKVNAFVDNTIEPNKKYYYGIFPYHIALDDEDHPIRHYRFTKVISVDTEEFIMAPTIENLEVSSINVTVTYDIPEIDGVYSYCVLVVKKGGIPTDAEDGDVIMDVLETMHTAIVTGLDEQSQYYFMIFTADTDGNTASSDPKDIVIGNAVWDFGYTGQVQEWDAPKTGVYSLETWGAQGGDATNGELTARGGYGAYAYGEVSLAQGDKLYINVGGQNGYGGGGLLPMQLDVDLWLSSLDLTHIKTSGVEADNILNAYNDLVSWYGTDWILKGGNTPLATLVYSNNEFSEDPNDMTCYAFNISSLDISKLTKFEADLYLFGTTTQWSGIGFDFLKSSANGMSRIERINLKPSDYPVGTWHHISLDVNYILSEANYLSIYKVDVGFKMKNIVFIYED